MFAGLFVKKPGSAVPTPPAVPHTQYAAASLPCLGNTARYVESPDGKTQMGAVFGPPAESGNTPLMDHIHHAKRVGKWEPDNGMGAQPSKIVAKYPTDAPWGGILRRAVRVQTDSPANAVNPMGEWLGDTTYDAYVQGPDYLIVQQLTQAPLQNPTTLAALGWQDAFSIISGKAPTGLREFKP